MNKIKQTKLVLVNIIVAVFLGVFALTGLNSTVARAVTEDCTGVDTSIIKVKCDKSKDGVEGTAVWGLLLMGLNILTAGVGLVAVAGVVYGSVLYTTASGDPAKVKKALSTFTNVGIGVVSYAAMYGLLNFITPGGLFN